MTTKEWYWKNHEAALASKKKYYQEVLKGSAKYESDKKAYYLKNRHIQLARAKKRRIEDPEYYKLTMRRLRQRRNDFVNRAKMKPCADCGIQYNPWVMEFDHRDPGQKINCISLIKAHSFEALKIEIAKCDVVCANCHCERTHKQWSIGFISRTGRIIKTSLLI